MMRIPANIRAKLKDQPFIFLFDSIQGDRSLVTSLVQKLLVDEWGLKEANRNPNRMVSVDSIPVFTPRRQPQQPNGCDCALYAVTNIEKMLSW